MNLSGNPIDYLFAFLGGIAFSFTPCVYPLIPISVSYIGIKAHDSKLKGLSLSLIYVTGMALTYSLLGLIASLTGRIFGFISEQPLTNIFVGTIILLFGVSMLEIFNFPAINLIKIPIFKKKNFLSTFLLGLISGFIVSPCVTPALGAILAYLTTKRNILYGMTLLLSFAYGMGLVLVLAGTFSSILVKLPKSGKWLSVIKKIGALVLIVTGIYFISTGIRRI